MHLPLPLSGEVLRAVLLLVLEVSVGQHYHPLSVRSLCVYQRAPRRRHRHCYRG